MKFYKLYLCVLTALGVCFLISENAKAVSVKIESPRNGARFESCGNVTIRAESDLPDSSIKRITFYTDGKFLKSLTNAPWEYTVEEITDGIYELSHRWR